MEETRQTSAFGALLKQLRVARGLSQEELAEKANVSTRGISDLERGARRSPHKHTLTVLSNALQLSDAERIQFLSAARGIATAPPTTTSPAASAAMLPHFLTQMIGREHIEAEVVALVRHNVARLVTLVGPAGIGKTRLSVQIAASLNADCADGVYFVPLVALRTAEEVFTGIAQVLGVRQVGGQSPQDQLIEVLRSKQLLLVLDNFEHLVLVAPQLAAILQACPRLTLLTTSRAVLHVRGEHVIMVPPLGVPEATATPGLQEAEQYSGIALFAQRARAVQSEFRVTAGTVAAIAAICRQLDGLPLAIELAAAWMRVLTPAALLARLTSRSALHLLADGPRDLPERHQTMVAALEWSYSLLSKSEQKLFRALSVFIGPCALTAIETLCVTTNADDLLYDLASLIDKSLVQREHGADNEVRFYQLETIRAYGLEQLFAAGEDQQQRRHAEYYRDLVVSVAPTLNGPEQQVVMMRLASEYANIRAAFHWFYANHAWEDGLQMAGACWRFWYVRGYLREGRQWLEQFLAAGETASLAARAQALFGAGMLATEQGDYQPAALMTEESVALYQSLQDWRGLAAALNVRGNIAKYQGDFTRADASFTESLRLHRQIGYRVGIAVALNNLATVAMEQGNYARAHQLQEQSLEIKRAFGDKRGQAVTLVNMGDTARDQGLCARAATLAEEALALFTELQDMRGQALALNNLGEAIRDIGDHARGRSLLMESLQHFRHLGDSWGSAVTLKNLGDIARAAADSKEAIRLYGESLNLYLDEDNHLGIAESLEAIGGIAAQQGEYAGAVHLLSAAAHLRRSIGTIIPPADSTVVAQDIVTLQAKLEPEAYASAWQRGETAALPSSIAIASVLCQRML